MCVCCLIGTPDGLGIFAITYGVTSVTDTRTCVSDCDMLIRTCFRRGICVTAGRTRRKVTATAAVAVLIDTNTKCAETIMSIAITTNARPHRLIDAMRSGRRHVGCLPLSKWLAH